MVYNLFKRKLEELSSSYELLQIEFANQAESAGETEERCVWGYVRTYKFEVWFEVVIYFYATQTKSNQQTGCQN